EGPGPHKRPARGPGPTRCPVARPRPWRRAGGDLRGPVRPSFRGTVRAIFPAAIGDAQAHRPFAGVTGPRQRTGGNPRRRTPPRTRFPGVLERAAVEEGRGFPGADTAV